VKVQSDRPQAGSVAEGGGNASLGAAERRGAVAVGCRVWLIGGAGQGACREVGSEGFEAKHRAVAENGEPVGPIQVMPSLHYGGEGNTWGAWAQQGVCGPREGAGRGVGQVFAVTSPDQRYPIAPSVDIEKRAH
jgi:hypothetical protein